MTLGESAPVGAHERAECPFCRGAGDDMPPRVATERMYGMGGTFHYRKCSSCGSLWLGDVPDLAPYYPRDYYAFAPADRKTIRTRLVASLRGIIDKVEWALGARAGRRHLISLARCIGLDARSAVLDVGCGDGRFLRRLHGLGMRRLVGVDPYAPPGQEDGVQLVRGTIADIDEPFDAIFFNHSLEHDAQPLAALQRARRLLLADGAVVVRSPVVNEAWRLFDVDWVQLDAPRHLSVPSTAGMRALAAESGFCVQRVVYDSTAFQFWASRAYARGETLVDAAPPVLSARWLLLMLRTLPDSARAALWNARGLGDQAAFVLRPVNA